MVRGVSDAPDTPNGFVNKPTEYTLTDIAQARDLGIIEGDAVAHMLVVSLQARVAELEAIVAQMKVDEEFRDECERGG
tara:strand:- start:15796 stop:16029 length:234 start_codon:yes stop_codon:yes gene_type:complete